METSNLKKIGMIVLLVGSFVIFGGAGCTDAQQGSYSKDAAKVEEVQNKLINDTPIPDLKTSATRQALAKRALLFDNSALTTYVYLVDYGKVMAYYPVKGNVVYLRSYLTPVDKIVRGNGNKCDDGDLGSCATGYVVGAPDIDGTYGENSDGIFFFTADTGAYVEWKGNYMFSDQPLSLTTPPELVRQLKDK